MSLFERQHYPHALFFAHLALEKLLKALVILRTGAHAPPVHNLVFLAEKAKLILNEGQKNDFQEITAFNVEARYPGEKLKIYHKTSNKKYATTYFHLMNEYRLNEDPLVWEIKKYGLRVV